MNQLTEEPHQKNPVHKALRYFTPRDLGIITGIAIVAVLFGYFGLPQLVPSLGGAGFVHGMLKLPGPGAGIVISSAVVCFWLLLGRLIVKKPWTAFLIALIIILIRVLWGVFIGQTPTDGHNQVAAILPGALLSTGIARLDVILVAAAIIELAFFFPSDRKPWRYLFSGFVGIMAVLTLLLLCTGQVTSGDNGAVVTAYPIGYVIVGILGICTALICYRYPVNYLAGMGVATMYYICHYWLFWGKNGFASAIPATVPAVIVLVTYAMVCGVIMGAITCGILLLADTYRRHEDMRN